MIENRNQLGYSLIELYAQIGITRQAVHQHYHREKLLENRMGELMPQVEAIRIEPPGCGVEQMYHLLQPNWIGRDRFCELLLEMGYRVKRAQNRIRTTYSIQSHYYPNLISGLELNQINQVWQTDITYFSVKDTYCYLTFIIDVYSRRIVGYHASDSLRAQANIKALKKAFRIRKGTCLQELIHHSDRGSQYIDQDYLQLLDDNHIQKSMCLKPQQNAFAERINGIIKQEYLSYWRIESIQQLKTSLARAVRHYNQKRPHRKLPSRSPPETFEKNLLKAKNKSSNNNNYLVYIK